MQSSRDSSNQYYIIPVSDSYNTVNRIVEHASTSSLAPPSYPTIRVLTPVELNGRQPHFPSNNHSQNQITNKYPSMENLPGNLVLLDSTNSTLLARNQPLLQGLPGNMVLLNAEPPHEIRLRETTYAPVSYGHSQRQVMPYVIRPPLRMVPHSVAPINHPVTNPNVIRFKRTVVPTGPYPNNCFGNNKLQLDNQISNTLKFARIAITRFSKLRNIQTTLDMCDFDEVYTFANLVPKNLVMELEKLKELSKINEMKMNIITEAIRLDNERKEKYLKAVGADVCEVVEEEIPVIEIESEDEDEAIVKTPITQIDLNKTQLKTSIVDGRTTVSQLKVYSRNKRNTVDGSTENGTIILDESESEDAASATSLELRLISALPRFNSIRDLNMSRERKSFNINPRVAISELKGSRIRKLINRFFFLISTKK